MGALRGKNDFTCDFYLFCQNLRCVLESLFIVQ
uniref:Uncharacterized protein n=1 Tax=Rhizophora mucronata TaxID=61149 RepID=A0A2P2NDI1_RHIMU